MSIPKVAQYMTANPYSIELRSTLAEAYTKMRRHQLRHLPVLAGTKLVGLVTDPDLQTLELLKGVDLMAVGVEAAMTPVPYCVTETTGLDEVAREMSMQRYEVAVVLRDAKVIGIFTASDAIRALSDLLHPPRAR